VTRTDIWHYCKVKYSRSIYRGWVDSFILRHKADLSETKSTPQEDARIEVSRPFLDEMLNFLREHVQGMKVELVLNLDEVGMSECRNVGMSECRNVGMSEWEDRNVRKVIVPITMDDQTIHHRASRSVRHISIITCISAAGESLTPYIITSQDSDAIRKRLTIHGFHLGVDFILRHWSKPYVSRKLFSNM
jgi:hypothetical protein